MTETRRILLGTAGQIPATAGTLEVAAGHYRLRPGKWIEEPQQVSIKRSGGSISMSYGNRQGIVADFQPRPLWGIEEGRPFTVLDARMTIKDGFTFSPTQVYEAGSILWGAHVEGRDSAAQALRVTFSLPWTGWSDDEAATLDQGRLSHWNDGKAPGLLWEPSQPHTVHNLTQRFPPLLTALFQLWAGYPVHTEESQVLIHAVGWCPVESAWSPQGGPQRSFLNLGDLTVRKIACWLEMARELGPLPFIAVRGSETLQVDAQMLATALEGLDRRWRPEARRFDGVVSKKQLNRARRQASQAAVEALDGIVEATLAKRVYDEALGHVQEPSYAEHLAELMPRVERVAPGLLGPSLSAWIQDMKDLRNIQSHGLRTHDDFGEEEITRYYVMSSSGRWALRLLLLLKLVDDDDLVRAALRDYDQFMFALVNIDRERYWENFSAYQTFLDHVRTG
jgi:hypothetical protein